VLLGSLGGELASAHSPATTFSDLVGAELRARWDVRASLPLEPAFEHVLFVTDGAALAADTELRPGSLLYVPAGREDMLIAAAAGSSIMLLGGVPLDEPLLMWWNFVARTPGEIAAADAEWRDGRFGEVGGYAGEPLAAPPLDASRLIRRT
jgi:redox-sensitive bicupin YhaK (pirin superfamily)